MKITSKLNFYFFLVLTIGFILIGGAYKLKNDFDRDIIYYSKLMTKDNGTNNESVSMGSNWYEKGSSTKEANVHIKPGDQFKGEIYLLNSKEISAEIKLKITPFECQNKDSAECKKYKDLDIKNVKFIGLQDNTVHLKPHEIAIIDYIVSIPQNTEKGLYFASISSVDQTKLKLEQNGNVVNLMAAYAIALKVDVTSSTDKFIYTKLINDPRDLATDKLLHSLRIYVSVLLAFLTLYFTVKSIKKSK